MKMKHFCRSYVVIFFYNIKSALNLKICRPSVYWTKSIYIPTDWLNINQGNLRTPRGLILGSKYEIRNSRFNIQINKPNHVSQRHQTVLGKHHPQMLLLTKKCYTIIPSYMITCMNFFTLIYITRAKRVAKQRVSFPHQMRGEKRTSADCISYARF